MFVKLRPVVVLVVGGNINTTSGATAEFVRTVSY